MAVLKHPVKDGAVGLPREAEVIPPELRQVLVLVLGGDHPEEINVLVGVEGRQLVKGALDGSMHGQLREKVVVLHERVRETATK